MRQMEAEMSDDVRNVVIIGSGPAGWTAALYAGRANLEPLVYEGTSPNTPGGQLMITSDVENFPGFPGGILGPDLMAKFKEQATHFGVDVVTDNIAEVDFSSRPFTLKSRLRIGKARGRRAWSSSPTARGTPVQSPSRTHQTHS